MNSKVDFAAGGIVLIDDKILLVKNRLSEEYKGDYDSGFWGYPKGHLDDEETPIKACLLYTSPSPRDMRRSRMPSSA